MLHVPLEPQQQPPERRRGGLRAAVGFVILMLGTLLMQVGRICVELGHHWGGRQARSDLGRAVAHFSDTTPERAAAPSSGGWQQTLLRFGPPVILSIVGVWALMWLAMLVGAPLAWLALNGYGAWLLLGCVALGSLIGCWLAYLHGKAVYKRNLN